MCTYNTTDFCTITVFVYIHQMFQPPHPFGKVFTGMLWGTNHFVYNVLGRTAARRITVFSCHHHLTWALLSLKLVSVHWTSDWTDQLTCPHLRILMHCTKSHDITDFIRMQVVYVCMLLCPHPVHYTCIYKHTHPLSTDAGVLYVHVHGAKGLLTDPSTPPADLPLPPLSPHPLSDSSALCPLCVVRMSDRTVLATRCLPDTSSPVWEQGVKIFIPNYSWVSEHILA